MIGLRGLLLLVLMAPAGTPLALDVPPATDCATPELPAFSKTTLVAERIAINGLPMRIVEARNVIPTGMFLEHFRSLWTAVENGVRKPRYVEYPLQGWQVIAHREGACFYTVQVRPDALTTTALLGMSTPDQALPPSAGPEISLPGGTQLLSHMASQDRARIGDTWVAQSDRSVPEAVRFFRETLGQGGWQALTRRDADTSGQTATLLYQKASKNLGIVIQPRPAGSTLVLTVQSR